MWRTLAPALLLTGCDLVFELEGPRDAGMNDGPVEVDAPPTCTRRTLPAKLIEDTAIVPSLCGGANRNATSTNINVGQEGTSRVLLRFSLESDLALAIEDGTLIGGALTIAPRPNDCACTNTPTDFQIHVATDDWNEGTGAIYSGADYCNRIGIDETDQTPWQIDGADGADDRSQLALATREVTASELTLPIAPITTTFAIDAQLRDELRRFVRKGRLSLLLRPIGGGVLFLYSREGLDTATTLTFDECR